MMNEEPPPRGSLFFCLLFFWVSKRKVRFNRQKIFLSLMSTTRPSIEERFCVPTLEKDGANPARLWNFFFCALYNDGKIFGRKKFWRKANRRRSAK